jgi:hypothetical protein
MDIVLEVIDTFVLDYVYAALLPAHPAPYDLLNNGNATSPAAVSTWQFKPASAYFNVSPSEAAYMSAWDRGNIYRQFISLFSITWCVLNSEIWLLRRVLTPSQVFRRPPLLPRRRLLLLLHFRSPYLQAS